MLKQCYSASLIKTFVLKTLLDDSYGIAGFFSKEHKYIKKFDFLRFNFECKMNNNGRNCRESNQVYVNYIYKAKTLIIQWNGNKCSCKNTKKS